MRSEKREISKDVEVRSESIEQSESCCQDV